MIGSINLVYYTEEPGPNSWIQGRDRAQWERYYSLYYTTTYIVACSAWPAVYSSHDLDEPTLCPLADL